MHLLRGGVFLRFSETKLATIAGNFSKKKKKEKIPLALLPGGCSVEKCYSSEPAAPAATCERGDSVASGVRVSAGRR